MIISSENPVGNYSAIQSNSTETLRVSLSSEMMQDLDLTQDQTVKGSVSEDGKSVTLNTDNGRVQIKGNFAQAAGEVVDVKVSTQAGELKGAEQPDKPKTGGPTSGQELDEIFEGVSEKIDSSTEFKQLMKELKTEIQWNGNNASGDIDIFQGSPVHIEFSKMELKDSRASVWDEAPEAREPKLGENSVDFGEGEMAGNEDDWGGFGRAVVPDMEGWSVNINHTLSNGDNVWLTGRVEADNHARLSMWFDNSGTAAYALQNVGTIQAKIESMGLIVDLLGIAPYPKEGERLKSTFMIEV